MLPLPALVITFAILVCPPGLTLVKPAPTVLYHSHVAYNGVPRVVRCPLLATFETAFHPSSSHDITLTLAFCITQGRLSVYSVAPDVVLAERFQTISLLSPNLLAVSCDMS